MTETYLKNKFKEYNQLYFNGTLKMPKIKLFKGRSVVGRFVYTEDKKTKRLKSKTIYIASNVDWDEDSLRRVLVHEMIHYYVACNPIITGSRDWTSHGNNFKFVMNRINQQFGVGVKIRDTEIRFNNKKEKPGSFFEKLWSKIIDFVV